MGVPRGRRILATVASVAAGALVATLLAGCGTNGGSTGGGVGPAGAAVDGSTRRVSLLLPETMTPARWEAADQPYFSLRVMQLCPDCTVDYRNANKDAAKQLSQAKSALEGGADVLVLNPVDGIAAGEIVRLAKERGVPVISYDRLVMKAPVDYYVSFDNGKVGQLQAEAMLDALGPNAGRGEILWINGSPTDNNATLFKSGAHRVLNGKVRIAAEFDTPDWNPDNAEAWAASVLASMKGRRLIGVYAANDGTAGGAVAALRAAGYTSIPPVTGQDAEVAALQRILDGEQYMTVYKAIRPEAEKAAELAVGLLRGERVTAPTTLDNGGGKVPSFLLDPIAVTRDNIKSTVIRDGFVTVVGLCAGAHADACEAAGIS